MSRSNSDDESPQLLRTDTHHSKLERKISTRGQKPDEFIWEDIDDVEYSHSKLSKFLPLISLLIVPCVLIPFFVGRGISSISIFDNSKDPKLDEGDAMINQNEVLSQELMRWGIWLTVTYSLFVLSWILLHYIPYLLFRIFTLLTRRKSEKIKNMFEYLRGLRRFIILLAIAIGSNIEFEVIWGVHSRGPNDRPTAVHIVVISSLLRIFVFYAIFRFGEKCLMMLLFVHLKNKTFKDRIKESKHALETIEHLEVQLEQNNAWKASKSRLKTEGSRLFNWIRSGQSSELDLTSNINAKRLAKKLFNSLSQNGETIIPSDFYPYFEDADAAQDAFNLFDLDRNGDCSKKEMKSAITLIYHERRCILSNVNDINSVVIKLDNILLIVVVIITVMFGFTVFGTNVVQAAVPLLSASLAISFVFADTAKAFFNSLLFLFATHPFDTGDIIMVKDCYYRVSEMSLMFSILEKLDGTEVYVSNSILSAEYIHNVRRSVAQSEAIEVPLKSSTSLTKLDRLQEELNEFLKSRPRDFNGQTSVDIKSFKREYSWNVMVVGIGIPYKRNHSDMGLKARLRNLFMRKLKQAIEDLGIEMVEN
eukprot:NODE_565_length_6632_cov_0.218276.p1 type:complete len:591 gc:universal NODE_565_length_6632_cov_0.218276:6403-4631(-)